MEKEQIERIFDEMINIIPSIKLRMFAEINLRKKTEDNEGLIRVTE